MIENEKKEKIKACIAIFSIILFVLIAVIFTIKYQVEGETNMPFKLSKITVVSNAEGIQKEGAQEKWNLSIFQNNDIYFTIEKNEKYKKENRIESFSIENIQITEKPELGEIKAYMPNSSDGRLFTYSEDTILTENKLTYKGGIKTNNKTLEIGNQGGIAVIRFSNIGVGNYISNEDEEIKHDGTMLTKTEANLENIKFTATFDLVLRLKNGNYKTTISLELPCGKNLLEEGTCSTEITDNIVFKRKEN